MSGALLLAAFWQSGVLMLMVVVVSCTSLTPVMRQGARMRVAVDAMPLAHSYIKGVD